MGLPCWTRRIRRLRCGSSMSMRRSCTRRRCGSRLFLWVGPLVGVLVGFLVPAVVCAQTPPASAWRDSAVSDSAVIDSLRQESLLALAQRLRDRDTVFGRVAVTASDAQARMWAANSIRDDPRSEAFLLAYF